MASPSGAQVDLMTLQLPQLNMLKEEVEQVRWQGIETGSEVIPLNFNRAIVSCESA